jgi:serine/threonine-protein kinase
VTLLRAVSRAKLAVAMDLPIGTVLGESYRVTRLIGVGGMGSIYEAEHTRVKKKRVAIKLMSKELAAYPDLLARFRREVKVTTDLAHPHIVDVVDFGEAPTGEPFLVMEYLDGEDLDHCLARVGKLPMPTVVTIVKQLASALAVAHGEGVVHRDLKPGNVFLLKADDGGVFVKLVDFGISKVLKSGVTQLTMARDVFGTPEFMAAEQAAGRVDLIDHRTDQWSLAAVAWLALSGHHAFSKPEVSETLNQVVAGEPNPLPREHADRIPNEVGKVLRRALSKLREDRFPTVSAFARAFEAAAGTAPARPSGPTPVLEGGSRRKRRRTGTWLSIGGIGLALAAAAWTFRADLPFSKWWPGGASSAGSAPSARSHGAVPTAPDRAADHKRRAALRRQP